MGLTYHSTKNCSMTDLFQIDKNENQILLALAGNPNTGKSTVFNALTGLHQHTGNWPGKTVVNASGKYSYKNKEYILVDLPGTYSLFTTSVEEEVARDFICFGNSDCVIVVVDATCLERNLSLLYQILELTNKVILCINLIDEAGKLNIKIDKIGLSEELKIPVVLCSARSRIGINDLKEEASRFKNSSTLPIHTESKIITYKEYIESTVTTIEQLIRPYVTGIHPRWVALRLLDGNDNLKNALTINIPPSVLDMVATISNEFISTYDISNVRDDIIADIYKKVEEVTTKYVSFDERKVHRDRKIDRYITSRIFGIPLMLLTLSIILWITISGANLPSALLSKLLFGLGDKLSALFYTLRVPKLIHGILIDGMYRTLAWVVSVMLPPMAIFFPLFTILEDLGYLPRVAFNLDHLFKKACAHGKQCLTMCMGLGCNAAGIIACRIIDSKRERLIAILTNNFIPCNGRFPMLIAIATVFLFTNNKTFIILPALAVTGIIILGIIITLLISFLLSKTMLKGIPSTFTLELPPYRVPQFGRVLYTSIIDRTIFVLVRAVLIAAPAGAITWICANIYIGDLSIISHIATFLNPFGELIGLDGFILMAFIFGLPANEIVLPILLMAYLSTGTMVEFDSIESLRSILLGRGWTYLTALNVMLFTLLHWPCATTLLTIRKETNSTKWMLVGAVLPTLVGIILCFITTSIARLIGFI